MRLPCPPAPYSVTQSTMSYMIPQPRHISSEEKIVQEPGTLSGITMKSAVQSNVSGTFLSKKHNINLSQGTRFELAIRPDSNSSSAASGS
ncbi:MAG: hypothetical protein ACYCOR_14785 [Acidobacteriaceae bacterium]